MPQLSYTREPYRFDAGPLGHIEGVTVSHRSNPLNNKTLCRYFGGLPYALPPIGPHRFRSPRPLPECYRYGTKANPGRFTRGTAICPQPAWRTPPDETLFDENCLQLNLYIPTGDPPSHGWPVFFYIHGGFLQWGAPNEAPTAIAPLLSETAFRAIIVMPAYRLNVFGFIASKELQAEAQRGGDDTAGNMGFKDQRLALEWTAANIRHFGGNPDNITVGGYSAGAHSTFQQLAHELYLVPDDKAIIKRVIMWSNSPGVQPKSLIEHQKQFDELLLALDIPLSLSGDEKLRRLRGLSARTLVCVLDKLKKSEFRAFSDGIFISKDQIANINNGDFARRMKARGIKLMNGECMEEHNLYRAWRTPSASYDAVYRRLCADYPERAVERLMDYHCGKSHALPLGSSSWQDLFGHLYADMQVSCLERGFANALSKGGLEAGKDILRYRFNWRAKCVDAALPPEWGVTHSSDMAIWFWGLYGAGLNDEEKDVLRSWNKAFAAFVNGDDVQWGTTDVKEMRRLKADGMTDIWVDDRWDEGVEIWNLVNGSDAVSFVSWLKSKL